MTEPQQKLILREGGMRTVKLGPRGVQMSMRRRYVERASSSSFYTRRDKSLLRFGTLKTSSCLLKRLLAEGGDCWVKKWEQKRS